MSDSFFMSGLEFSETVSQIGDYSVWDAIADKWLGYTTYEKQRLYDANGKDIGRLADYFYPEPF
jgi:hypothetical protein